MGTEGPQDSGSTTTGAPQTTSASNATSGDTATTGDELIECAPDNISLNISTWLAPCTDVLCDSFSNPWGGPFEEEDSWDITYSALCTVGDFVDTEEDFSYWTLEGCIGEGIPDHGRLAIGWTVEPNLLLALSPGESVELRYRTLHNSWDYDTHVSWSVRRADESLVVARSSGFYLPDTWISEPISITASAQECTPFEACSGVGYTEQLHFALAEELVVVPARNTGEIGESPLFDLFVLEARSGSGFQCGMYSSYEIYDMLIVERA